MTKVTVAMNVYNGMPYLCEAMESVRRQTLEDIKILVINDGSTDGSADYLEGIDDARLRIVHQENQGCSVASNCAIELCDTPYLARMDADDVSLPNRITEQLAFMENHPEVGMCGTQTACLGTHSVGGSIKLPVTHEAICQGLESGQHAMAHPTLMMRTEKIRAIDGYWSFQLADDDTDMMLRMSEITRLANVDLPLYHYRVHQGSLSACHMRGMRFSYEFAIELARRRRSNLPAITPQQFAEQLSRRPWGVRAFESLEIYGRVQYRQATEEMFGGAPWRGRLRLAWAATCSPRLTWQRILRMMRPVRAQP